MRRQLVNGDDSTEFCVHDHTAWCGEGTDVLGDIAVRAFRDAAGRGERMLFISDRPDPRRLGALAGVGTLLERGDLQLGSVEDSYPEPLEMDGQLALFEGMLEEALDSGYSGICVVADNSRLVSGSDDQFAAWLGWEALADGSRPHGR